MLHPPTTSQSPRARWMHLWQHTAEASSLSPKVVGLGQHGHNQLAVNVCGVSSSEPSAPLPTHPNNPGVRQRRWLWKIQERRDPSRRRAFFLAEVRYPRVVEERGRGQSASGPLRQRKGVDFVRTSPKRQFQPNSFGESNPGEASSLFKRRLCVTSTKSA